MNKEKLNNITNEVINKIDKNDINRLGISRKTYSNPLSLLREGLIATYSVEDTVKYVKKYLNFNTPELDKLIIIEKDEQGNDYIIILLNTTWKNYDFIYGQSNHAMELCGYFLASVNPLNNNNVALQYESKYGDNKINVKDYSYIYHVTPLKNLFKINKNGICPYHKNSAFDYHPRSYFFINMNKLVIKLFTRNLEKENGFVNKQYSLLTIDTALLNDNIIFYADPNYKNAIYIYENLSPKSITEEETFDLIK